MKFKNYIFLFWILFCFQGCNSKKIKISNKVFEVEDIGDKEIPFTYYEKEGFKLVYEDITIFEKKNKDTLTLLYVNDELETIDKKVWKIKLKSLDKRRLSNWIDWMSSENMNMSILHPITETKKGALFFNVLNYVDNSVYVCKVKQEYGIDYLFIEYYYPLKEKQIQKNIENYKKDNMEYIYDETEAQEKETKMLNENE